MSNSYFPAEIDTITPALMRDFLLRKGWRVREHRNQSLLLMHGGAHGDQREGTLVLPNDSTMDDYRARLRDALTNLTGVFTQSIPALVDAILHWDRDIYRIRLQNAPNREQLLPLECAAEVIAKYRDFIAFAAATQASPRRFFAKLTGAGREFVEGCYFGHTFVGSFGLTIECPLNLPRELPLPGIPPPPTFNRSVTERVATGFLSMQQAVEREDPEVIVRSHEAGFSGNMCEVLTDIYEYLDGREISQRIAWSPEAPPSQELAAATESVTIDSRSYEVLKAASASLQKVDEPEQDKTIVGRITKLRSEQPPLNTEEFASATRTIVLRWEMEKKQPLHVNVVLPLNEYRAACDAHKNGRKLKIIGKPEKRGKFWYLRDQHGFEIV